MISPLRPDEVSAAGPRAQHEDPGAGAGRRHLAVYALTVALPVALVLAVLLWLARSGALGASAPTAAVSPSIIDRLLLAIVVVVALGAAGGVLARRLGQPAVVGELLGGMLLGPSVLGAISPSAQGWLFPAAVLPFLSALAQLGVIFFMFLIGTELAPGALRRSGPRALVIGHASVALPFAAGITVAWSIRHRYQPSGSGTLPFLLFVGLSFAVTAFPVLARILSERGMLRTPLGTTGLAAAGVGDVTAWCLLAFVVAVVRQSDLGGALVTLALVVAFALLMIFAVRPLAAWLVARAQRGAGHRAALSGSLVCLVLAAGLATDRMGVHAMFGAFLAGAIMPHDAPFIRELTEKIEGITMWVMLPLFFVTVGLQTRLGALDGASWLVCLLVVAVAVTTKVAGTAGAAAAIGERPRNALALGVMMSCRGLTELIVLQLGLQLGVLDQRLFAVFVIMALVTTAMTGPLLSRLTAPTVRRRPIPEE